MTEQQFAAYVDALSAELVQVGQALAAASSVPEEDRTEAQASRVSRLTGRVAAIEVEIARVKPSGSRKKKQTEDDGDTNDA